MSGVADYVYYNGVEHGVAEERARVVAMLRAEASMWTDFLNRTGGQADLSVTDALDDMADRIERGET